MTAPSMNATKIKTRSPEETMAAGRRIAPRRMHPSSRLANSA